MCVPFCKKDTTMNLLPDWMQQYVDPADAGGSGPSNVEWVPDAPVQNAEMIMQPNADSNPDAFSSAFSRDSANGSYEGFGPGNYKGGYTGVGDSIYWGQYNDPSEPGSQGAPFHELVHGG